MLIIQERKDIAANVAIRLGRHNPKLYPQFPYIQLPPERLHAFEDNSKAKLQAREIGVEIVFGDARGLAVLFPDLRNRQPQYVLDPRVSDDRADGARRIDERHGAADRSLGKAPAELYRLRTLNDLRCVFRTDAEQDVSARYGIHSANPLESRALNHAYNSVANRNFQRE